jgi:hypothetical protein
MTNLVSRIRSAVMATCVATAVAVPANAAPATTGATSEVQVAQADCYAIGQQVAAQNGGTLARASLSNQGGQAVCVIVVLVPGKDGQRPRRAEFVVPAN